MPTISIFCHDLSSNCLGRAYTLAQALAPACQVEIVGPTFGRGVWKPCRGGEFPYRTLAGARYPWFGWQALRLTSLARGDLLYAVKPRPTSFGLALLHRAASRRPLMLDVDDWETGFFLARSSLARLGSLADLTNPNSYGWTLLAERLAGLADAVTVVSGFLQQRFGGVMVPHGRDLSLLDPARVEREPVRRSLGLAGKQVVLFLGTPRRHKGMEELIAALSRSRRQPWLLVVGAGARAARRLRESGFPRMVILGPQPLPRAAEFLAAADLVALPQRDSPASRAQVPAKLVDAMAMARPVVASAVGDIPQILEGCGLVTPPGEAAALAAAIDRLLEDPELASKLGQQARRRAAERFSLEAMRAALYPVIERLLPGKG